MRIVFLNPVGVMGGAERLLLTAIASLKTQAPDVDMHLIVGAEGELLEQAQALGIAVHYQPLPQQVLQLGDSGMPDRQRNRWGLLWSLTQSAWSAWRYAHRLKQFILTLQPDLVHSNGIKTHVLTGLMRLTSIPVIWHIHDFYSLRPVITRLLRRLNQPVTFGIAVSQAIATDAQTVLPQFKLRIIPNGIDTGYFSPQPRCDEWPSQVSQLPSNKQLRIGLVATFARWKGQDIFLRAIQQLVAQHSNLNCHFYMIGGAIYATAGSQWSQVELQAQVEALDIADQVTFLGFQTDMPKIYNQLDIVVHASTKPEPFGLAIAEAMACGKPVIVAQSGGAAELFAHGIDGWGVLPGDATALAAAIQQLVSQSDLRARMGQAARQTAVTKLGSDRLGTQLLQLYGAALQKPSGSER